MGTTQKLKVVQLSTLTKKLHVACQEGSLEQVKDIIKLNTSIIDAPNDAGNTPLMIALKANQSKVLTFLLAQGANVNSSNNAGQTPLQLACWKNLRDAASVLLQNGADINSQDLRGWNSLMICAKQGNEEIVRLLLKYKPDVNQVDRFGKKAADRAATQRICEMIQSLGIDQTIFQPEQARKTTISKLRSLSNKSSKAMARPSVPEDSEYATILSYYISKFTEQIAVLSQKLSCKSQKYLETVIQEEMDKAELFLRNTTGNELGSITEKMKKQIDQHISLKIKLASAKAGVEINIPKGESKILSAPRVSFPTNPTNRVYSQVRNPNNKMISRATTKKIKRLNNTIDSLVYSKEDLFRMVKQSGISPRNLSKDKQELYCQLQKDVAIVIGERIEEIAQTLASETKKMISGIMKERMCNIESEIKKELQKVVNGLGKDFKTRVDSMVNEKITRTLKQIKTEKEEVRMSADPAPQIPHYKSESQEQLSDLKSSIRKLDESYQELLRNDRSLSSRKEKNFSSNAKKQSVFTNSVKKSAEKPPYYMSIKDLASGGNSARIDYTKVDTHNSRICPSLDLVQDHTEPKPEVASAREFKEQVHYIGDKGVSTEEDDHLSSLMAKYSNVYHYDSQSNIQLIEYFVKLQMNLELMEMFIVCEKFELKKYDDNIIKQNTNNSIKYCCFFVQKQISKIGVIIRAS